MKSVCQDVEPPVVRVVVNCKCHSRSGRACPQYGGAQHEHGEPGSTVGGTQGEGGHRGGGGLWCGRERRGQWTSL